MPPPLAAQLAALPEAGTSELVSLYADMSGQRHSNTGAFRQRLAWWASTLERACWEQWDRPSTPLVLRVDADMPNRWAMDSAGRPLCLAVVVVRVRYSPQEELARQRRLIRVDEYGASSVGRLARAVRALGAPAWRWLTASDDSTSDEALWPAVQGAWVVVANVERAAQRYLSSLPAHRTLFESVVSRAELQAHVAEMVPGLGETDLDVLLTYLERDRHAIAVDGDVVKLVYGRADARGIGEQERGIHATKQAHAQLSRQVDELRVRIERAQAQAADAVRTKAPRTVATSCLRTKKQLEDMLTKRVGALETISALLLQMEQATGDAAILRTYEASERTLRSILADPALQPERVDAVVDGLADALHAQEEVHEAMQVAPPADTDDLAEELAALQLEAQAAPERPAEAQAAPERPAEAQAAPGTPAEAQAAAKRIELPAAPQHAPRQPEALLE
ncbi:unnamed protein product [Malassezia sympodialis ATCC 42132]|uniref:uncharacterized protein n=1 Tax=Malassezia sympodialis (strain ATCC 42132) TaxID=1230383 RepID=UPI0002C2014A|nr:uncharacterized protein MSY001_2770 [Malassezia sympodialis ATCC 42132]CCV00065.1 unnamed protein product [Malassezia sympodialis ATCC 42132]|eukprot:XP_018741277.1 uncharacterized protein MSY001_2770 [Malassezia sympodialis ATCC 42132]